jgi:hypothetical protein
MKPSENMSTILVRWQGKDICRRDASLPVWDIGRPGLFARRRRLRRQAVAACRQELLTTLLRSDGPIFIMHHEPPKEYDVPGTWRPAGKATWLVPEDFNLDHPAVKRWLFDLGDWSIYSALQPVEGKCPDVFRCSAAELVAWMSSEKVHTLIESFHDDTVWVVAFNKATY